MVFGNRIEMKSASNKLEKMEKNCPGLQRQKKFGCAMQTEE